VALYILANMVSMYGRTHHFWTDGVTMRDETLLIASEIAGPKQITDIYLLVLCQKNGGTLVTLDTRMSLSAIVAPDAALLRTL